jgi:acyl transferase domain-containing protein/NAD(P)-dependent dehydrogenase (short-subunit alcohol dehydrogenase family)
MTGLPEGIEAIMDTAVAVTGMATRVPGARDPETFWENLKAGVESVRELSREELAARGVDPALLADPAWVFRGAALDGPFAWDAGFWGFSPREAAVMDPQTRHFLELSWEAMEKAGYAPGTFQGPVGVFGGCGPNTYMMFHLLGDPEVLRSMGFFLVRHIGNDKDFLPTRVSYHLNLTGPGIGVQTACSTSLTAVHLAVQSLLAFECDMALAGGITINFPHLTGYRFEEGEILSPDGRCRAFDADSEGTVLGDGGAVVVLRRLRDAMEAGDPIHAVIRGSAVNNDGSSKVGYLAPSVDGQARAISEALVVADVDPESIGYVEAHGTATRVGDPIEMAALTQAYRAHTDRTGYCWIGSVKTNIGHLDTAAGVAGLVKAVCTVRDGIIPPSLHFRAPNPGLALESSPFRVPTEAVSWPEALHPRRAAVSSLGVGGTNVHVILEAPPPPGPGAPDRRSSHLLVLSARSRAALERSAGRLVDHLELRVAADEEEARQDPSLQRLADVAWTLQAGRAPMKHSRILVGRTREEFVDALVTGDAERIEDHEGDGASRTAAFLFAGGGAQYPGMARDLQAHEPVFRAQMDDGLRHLRDGLGESALHDRVAGLLGLPGAPPLPEGEAERPSVALPALFLVQLAQARLWMSWGVTPTAMIGHSMGEYTAAVLAGVMEPREALELVVLRGRLFEEVERGGMLGVPLSEDALRPLLAELHARRPELGALSVAAVNGPELTVASGPTAAIEALEAELLSQEVEARRIHIDVAAHSSMLEPILERFRARLRQAALHPPRLPFASNLTGTWITAAEATDPDYWVRQLRETVRFSDGLERLLEDPTQVLLEVGPGRTLATLARLHPGRDTGQEIFTSLRHPDEEVEDDRFMLQVLGRLWQRGVPVDWAGVHGGAARRRVPLPTYPFERDIYVVEPRFRLDPQADPRLQPGGVGGVAAAGPVGAAPTASGAAPVGADGPGGGSRPPGAPARDEPGVDPTLVEAEEVARWIHAPRWVAGTQAVGESPTDQLPPTLTLAPGSPPPPADLLALLAAAGVELRAGAGEDDGDHEAEGDVDLPRILVTEGLFPEAGEGDRSQDSADRAEELFRRLFEVGKGLAGAVGDGSLEGDEEGGPAVELVILTRGATDGTGDPAGAVVAGPARVLPAETPGLVTRWIDLPVGEGTPLSPEALRAALGLPIPQEGASVVALRGKALLTPDWSGDPGDGGEDASALRLEGILPEALPSRPVCLITGGFGGVGLEVARHLARSREARLVLLGRTPLEPGSTDPRVRRALALIQELEDAGAEVLPLVADVTDADSLAAARDRAMEAFGKVDALFHSAGILDDGLALFKEVEATSRVLAPKVRGTVLLDQVFRGAAAPRVAVLFSSVSAEAGLPGQIDYTAANAFLDAWARSRNPGGKGSGVDASTPTRWISVGWSAWAQTGMAVDGARGLVAWPPLLAPRSPWSATPSPLFDAVLPGEGKARVRLRDGRLWMLDEHRTADGLALIPGAGYLELIRGAEEALAGGDDQGVHGTEHATSLVLEELYFLAPFFVPDGATRELEVRLPPRAEAGGEVVVVGRSAPEESWTEHLRARLVRTGGGAAGVPVSGSTAPPAASTPEPTLDFAAPGGAEVGRQDLAFGPRWANVRGLRPVDEGVVELALELDPAFRADLEEHPLHPALLDNATALAGPLLPGFGEPGSVYVPASYGTFRMIRPLPARIRSWIRQVEVSGEMVTLEVHITDEEGVLLAEARDFVMVRVAADELEKASQAAREMEAGRGAAVAAAAASEGLPTALGLRILEEALALATRENGVEHPYLLVTRGSPGERIARLREAAAAGGARPGGAGAGKAGGRGSAPAVDVTPVEAALLELEAVKEAAVTAHEDRPGEIRLVAHVVLDPGMFATVSELRRGLRAVLPREQVPQNFVQLDALPRTRRGGVDRGALVDPFAPVDAYVAPETPIQRAVASIWGDLLGSDRVGIHDNFLDIGGHSLLAMRAILRIEKETGVRLGPVEMNMYTLEQIAAHIEKAGGGASAGEGEGAATGSSDTGGGVYGEGSDPGVGESGDQAPAQERGGILSGLRRFIPGGS